MRDEAQLPNIVDGILRQASELNRAKIFQGTTQRPFEVQKITLDLTTAKREDSPYKISFPFQSIYVGGATDVLTNVSIKVNSPDAIQSSFPLYLKDSVNFPFPVSEAYIHWTAQSGKSIDLYIFVSGEFRSGSQISVTGGGVSIVEGSTSTLTSIDLLAAARTQLCATNASRKIARRSTR